MNVVNNILGKSKKKRNNHPEDDDIVEFGSTYKEAYDNEVDRYGN